MDFGKYLEQNAGKLDKQIEKILDEWIKEVEKIDKKLVPLGKAFIKSCTGGKRIRGTLVKVGYEIGKQSSAISHQSSDRDKTSLIADSAAILKADSSIFKVAAAYEILHTASLIHDDIIDRSPTRRGQKSLYKALGGYHYGVSQGISLGDIGFFLTVKIISESKFPEVLKNKVLRLFSKTMIDTGLGEILDVEKGDPLILARLKTARYSVCAPLQIGAILARADHRLVRILGEFGENLGIAYQIQDDILGIFGEEKTLGKSVTSDIEEGKNTTLFEYALKNADRNQKEVLEKLYGKGKIRSHGLEVVRRIFKGTRALDYAENEAKKYKNKALKMLPGITKDQKMSKILQQLAEYLVERKK